MSLPICRAFYAIAFSSLSMLSGCGGDDAPPMADATAMDATVDAPVSDASSPDAMIMDASVPDSSIPDVSIPDASIPDASVPDAEPPMVSCMEIQSFYEDSVGGPSATECPAPGFCEVRTGHCSVGLGGCYYAVARWVSQESLDHIARQWTDNGCDVGAPVCDCGPRPRYAVCGRGDGRCRLGP